MTCHSGWRSYWQTRAAATLGAEGLDSLQAEDALAVVTAEASAASEEVVSAAAARVATGRQMKQISEIAASIGLTSEDIDQSGQYIAKVTPAGLNKRFSQKRGKYIVITAITPTGSGEGKTTVAIGLGMAMRHIDRK